MTKGTKRSLIALAILAFVAVALVVNLRRGEPGQEVESTIARFQPLISKVKATGYLKARSQVSIQPQILSRVQRLHVKEGDLVQEGQLLAELDRSSYELAARIAALTLSQARRSFARLESLYRLGLTSDETFEQARMQLESAQAQYDQAADQLEKTTIRAPITGRVVQVNVQEGEMAITGTMNFSGTIMMTVADLAHMRAVVEASETYIPQIQPGQTATLKLDAFPETTFAATVIKVGYMPVTTAMTSTEKSTDFQVELELEQPTTALRPGMTVSAEIVTSCRDSVLSVPIQSVGHRKIKGHEAQSLFVIKGGIAHLVPVQTGIVGESDIEILSGVEPGSEVITGPYKTLAKLKDGARVHSTVAQVEGKTQDNNLTR
ncbi:MAG: efflux RND transporter periplasmic adaptor subunit [candidate division WOR-3 bacterium]